MLSTIRLLIPKKLRSHLGMALLRSREWWTTPRNNVWARKRLLPLSTGQHQPKQHTVLLLAESPPQPWLPHSVLGKILERLGVTVTTDCGSRCDVAFAWSLPLDPAIRAQVGGVRIINDTAFDCAKSNVAACHERVFGYSAAVDPLTHSGPCVAKADSKNGAHDGRVIHCPIPARQPDVVYQTVIDNRVNERFVEDIRVPFIDGEIPFVYLKYRPVQTRFGNDNAYAMVTSPCQVLSENELALIVRFCREILLEFGELDILRDRTSGRIFIVDVNNCAFGPPNHMPPDEKHLAVSLLAQAFYRRYLASSRAPTADSPSLGTP